MIGPSKVQVGGFDLDCETDGLAKDASIRLAIRAEDIVVGGGDSAADNRISARLDELEFNGAFLRANLTAPQLDGASLVADVAMGLIRGQQIRAGDTVPITLPRELIRVFPSD